MAASPSYGERPTMQGAFRRSFTVPARSLSFHEKAGLDNSDANADTLYSHPIARIISFSPPTESVKSTSKAEIPADTDYPIDTVETLPWRSRSEALIASGLMVIEKVRGSTNFLKCQDIMHAILRNSQCWCVDGESKFVLRVRKFQYYRIELPSTTQEDKARVEELKKVFPTVLRFERTPCPFIRAFTVDLPDDAITPRRKGQWKRRDSSQSNTPETETPPLRSKRLERSWSSQTPPSSYPRNSLTHNSDGDRGRPAGPAAIHRRRSLFENQRNSSPASLAWNEDGTDSDQPGSGHDSELENTTDRSGTSSPRKLLGKSPRKERIVAEFSADELDVDVQGLTKRFGPNAEATELGATQAHSQEPVAVSDGAAQAASPGDQQLDALGRENSNESALPGTTQLTPLSEVHDIAKSDTGSPEYPSILDPSSRSTNDTIDASEADRVEEGSQTSKTGSPARISDTAERDELYDTLLREVSVLPESPAEADLSHGAQEDLPIHTLPNQIETKTNAPIPLKSRLDTTGPAATLVTANTLGLESGLSSHSVPEPGLENNVNATPKLDFDANGEQPVETIRNDDDYERGIQPLLTTSGLIRSSELPIHKRDGIAGGAEDDTENSYDLSPVSSVDSFHTLASTVHRDSFDDQLDSEPTPTGKRQAPYSSVASRHRRDVSEATVTALSESEPALHEHGRFARQEHGPSQKDLLLQSFASDTSWPEPVTPTAASDKDSVRQRFQARKRSFSPLPPASTIFTGNQIRHDSGRGHMTKTILQKVVVKPIEVAILMIHILARIASGATVNDLLSGELFKKPDQQKALSGSMERQKDSKSGSETEDDYGVPIRGRRRSSEMRMAAVFDDETDENFAEID